MSERSLVYPVVMRMRMRGLWPRDMIGYKRHLTRRSGDLGHVDPSRSRQNKRLIGKKTWAQDTWNEIGGMRAENHVRELEQLKERRRKAEMLCRIAEGPRDPWRATQHGPMREIILTANRRWFEDDLIEFLGGSGPTREEEFEARAIACLKHHFGDDCVHARDDLDEEAYHIHAVILPRTTTKGGRRMLQPSVHSMIRDYEGTRRTMSAPGSPTLVSRAASVAISPSGMPSSTTGSSTRMSRPETTRSKPPRTCHAIASTSLRGSSGRRRSRSCPSVGSPSVRGKAPRTRARRSSRRRLS